MITGNLIIKNAAQLVTCSGFTAKSGREMAELNVIEDGALIAENGIIQTVGRTAEILQGVDATGFTVIDAAAK
ncbi:MAG: imidazolonepropionase, partial [Desulfobacterales bacterium]